VGIDEGLQLGQEKLQVLVGQRLPRRRSRGLARRRLSLIASGVDETGLLKEFEGEPTLVGPLDAQALGDTKSAFLAGSPDSTPRASRA
jgi:hypothetical protein